MGRRTALTPISSESSSITRVGPHEGRRESEYFPLPRESEYIKTNVRLDLPVDFLFSFHCLKEVRMIGLDLEMKPDTHFSLDASLFHTLKVLSVSSISLSFFAGQAFHKLERFMEGRFHNELIPEQGPLTEMPVCTRLVVRLSTLATLKLPQIRELSINKIDNDDHIWGKQIAVNANLSGLKLLHVRHVWREPSITLIKIFGLLPVLESLILGGLQVHCPFIDCLETLVPMNVPAPSGPNQSSCEGQTCGVLCPRLESLQIEGFSPTERAELMPVLKDIVTLRAAVGSPLKSFTFYHERQKWQLIGRDTSFMIEEVVPAEKFRLDI